MAKESKAPPTAQDDGPASGLDLSGLSIPPGPVFRPPRRISRGKQGRPLSRAAMCVVGLSRSLPSAGHPATRREGSAARPTSLMPLITFSASGMLHPDPSISAFLHILQLCRPGKLSKRHLVLLHTSEAHPTGHLPQGGIRINSTRGMPGSSSGWQNDDCSARLRLSSLNT